jgi:hypothetical protein
MTMLRVACGGGKSLLSVADVGAGKVEQKELE